MNDAPLAGLNTIAQDYDAVLCDVWGVLHDGESAHDGAADALARFRRKGPVVLLTNAPRPSPPVVRQLEELGIDGDAYDAIVSSGDVVRRHLIEAGVRRVHHIGPDRDWPLYQDTPIEVVDAPGEAEMVVIAGLRDDRAEAPEDYRDELAAIRELNVPLICANPDIVVERGGSLIHCAGALAKVYESLGGTAEQFGKPHPPIYRAALEEVRARAPHARKILAIGDGLPTDITGANLNNFAAFFITGGIHEEELGEAGHPEPGKVAERLGREGLTAAHYAARLLW